jgi:Ran GTPase-activating protein (RanGAP) involved in mRNA processing and transport
LQDAGFAPIASVLRENNSSLQRLVLANCGLTDACAPRLADLLVANPRCALECVDLQRNSLSDVGTIALAAALKSNRRLTTLILRFNRIGDAGAIAIGVALHAGSSPLRELDLGGNRIGSAGMIGLAHAFESVLSQLERLNARQNQCGDEGAVALVRAIASSRAQLRELYLGLNMLSARGVEAIFDVLRGGQANLSTLDLQDAAIDVAAARSVAEFLRGDVLLQELVLAPLDGATADTNEATEAMSALASSMLSSNKTLLNWHMGDIDAVVVEPQREALEVIRMTMSMNRARHLNADNDAWQATEPVDPDAINDVVESVSAEQYHQLPVPEDDNDAGPEPLPFDANETYDAAEPIGDDVHDQQQHEHEANNNQPPPDEPELELVELTTLDESFPPPIDAVAQTSAPAAPAAASLDAAADGNDHASGSAKKHYRKLPPEQAMQYQKLVPEIQYQKLPPEPAAMQYQELTPELLNNSNNNNNNNINNINNNSSEADVDLGTSSEQQAPPQDEEVVAAVDHEQRYAQMQRTLEESMAFYFAQVQRRFGQMEQLLTGLDQRLQQVEGQYVQLNAQLGAAVRGDVAVEERVVERTSRATSELSQRLARVERFTRARLGNADEHVASMPALQAKLSQTMLRVEALETALVSEQTHALKTIEAMLAEQQRTAANGH